MVFEYNISIRESFKLEHSSRLLDLKISQVSV